MRWWSWLLTEPHVIRRRRLLNYQARAGMSCVPRVVEAEQGQIQDYSGRVFHRGFQSSCFDGALRGLDFGSSPWHQIHLRTEAKHVLSRQFAYPFLCLRPCDDMAPGSGCELVFASCIRDPDCADGRHIENEMVVTGPSGSSTVSNANNGRVWVNRDDRAVKSSGPQGLQIASVTSLSPNDAFPSSLVSPASSPFCPSSVLSRCALASRAVEEGLP